MSFSKKSPSRSWPSPEREMWDRLRDLEHATEDHEEDLTSHRARLDGHDTQLRWHTAAMALMFWAFLQGKAVEYMPQIAQVVAQMIEAGLRR